MEIILVDDGSPDSCPQLCDEWAQRDQRIRVIHKANGGLSDARNAGINIATGEYITFVDSDDYLAPDTYAPLLERMGDNDILEYAIDERLTLNDNTYEDINERIPMLAIRYSSIVFLKRYVSPRAECLKMSIPCPNCLPEQRRLQLRI